MLEHRFGVEIRDQERDIVALENDISHQKSLCLGGEKWKNYKLKGERGMFGGIKTRGESGPW
jgi:hypothetical protein